jgi:mannan endo-1,4-beta-mannosidase
VTGSSSDRWVTRWAGTLVLAVLVAMLAGTCGQGTTRHPDATGSGIATAVSHGHLIGFSTPGFPQDLTAFLELEGKAGVRADVASWYTVLGTNFNAAAVARISDQGLLPLIEIDSDKTPVADIADGTWDAFLTAYARAVAGYHSTVAIDFDHEFNGEWSEWGYSHTSPSAFVAAWRRMVTIFRENGATNVIWVWNPNVTASGTVAMKPWYPGDQYVTWVGLDGYFFHSGDTFGRVFGTTLSQLNSFSHKKVFIVETGAEPGTQRSTQINSLFAGLKATPQIVGFIWFDYDKRPDHEWALQGDEAALATFHKDAASYQRRYG